MKGIYYIENYVDERRSRIRGYYLTLDEAKNDLKNCSDWFRPSGTGRIYYREFGLNKEEKLVFEK